MVIVKAKPGDTTDSMVRRFVRQVLNEGILQDLKEREFYVKPAIKRKEAKKALEHRRKRW